MAIRIVRLGSPRHPREGLRIGAVRRPPRAVPKAEYAARDWFDVWYPELAPSAETLKLHRAATTPAQFAAFLKRYRAEMNEPAARRTIELLAALSKQTDFSLGCYCEDDVHCHRSVLRALLADSGARFA